MKIHEHLVFQIVAIIQVVFSEGGHADKEIEKHFKQNRKLGARDRKFIAESVYELVRWWKKYFVYAYHFKQPSLLQHDFIDDNEGLFFQEKYLQNEAFIFLVWTLWWFDKKHNPDAGYKFDFITDEDFIHIRKFLKNAQSKKWPRSISQSIPRWLDSYGVKQFGERWNELVQTLNVQARAYLRTNTLKITREELIEKLELEKINANPVKDVPSAVVLAERKNVFITESFKNGYFEMQDVASQLVAPLLRVEPGQRVMDACAGAGGKTLHLAQLMKNKGKIIALDIHQWKLDEMKKRARRNGVDIIESRLIEGTKTFKRLEDSFDRLLLDVPCSGLGVLRRNPDSKWKLSLNEIQQLISLQRKILTDYTGVVKSGGYMVYATCSILPEENEKQVQWFLSENKKFELVEELKIDPVTTGYDGFYAALLKRV